MMPSDVNDSRAPDDLDAYLATLSDLEREEIEIAGMAIDVAVMLYQARAARGLTQGAAAQLAGLAQQAVSRFERPQASLRLDTLRRYLGALGYVVEITVKDAESDEVAARLSLSPVGASDEDGPRSAPVHRHSAA